MRVGIRFSDNDFYNYICSFFELYIVPNFVEREEGHMVTHLTSSMIVDMFNLYMPYVYRYNNKQRERRYQEWDIGDYLIITEASVYWDDKTDDYVGKWEDGNGCEFIWTDGKSVY